MLIRRGPSGTVKRPPLRELNLKTYIGCRAEQKKKCAKQRRGTKMEQKGQKVWWVAWQVCSEAGATHNKLMIVSCPASKASKSGVRPSLSTGAWSDTASRRYLSRRGIASSRIHKHVHATRSLALQWRGTGSALDEILVPLCSGDVQRCAPILTEPDSSPSSTLPAAAV